MAGDLNNAPTAAELVAAYAAGTLSPVEATAAALAAIQDRDADYNAFVLVDPERALADARAAESRWRAGTPAGPLDGVPMSIKDLFLTRGWPTLRGSGRVDPAQPWDVDSPVAARLREGGLVPVGKTSTPEMGWKGVCDNPLTGVTRNPWDTSRTSGGSSGGSAVAVAAGMGPLSVGTDGGGSIRIPAAFCGVVGFKPTHGRVSQYPLSALAVLAHAGPMARTVQDAALLLDALAPPDHRDPYALAPHGGPYAQALDLDVRGVTAAFSADFGYVDVHPEVAAAVASAVAALEGEGVRVEAADPGFPDPLPAFNVLWCTGAAKWRDALGTLDGVDPGLCAVIERGLGYSAGDYLAAEAERLALSVRMGEFHTRHDVLITPTVPIPAFEAGHDVPPGSDLSDWAEWTPFTYPFNMTHQPAISVPVGFTSDGLPVGLQIVGPRHSEPLVLAMAHAVERTRPAGARVSVLPKRTAAAQ
ncbi:amidase [Actinomadura decatromicini]|uniref:Amidase n=1 Tax=Actinomadura decatromicini TaxID=2604572 RepID=A0A5D3FV13_9ACTN|nr:amidase [Actinomadura decatromicini]TYK50975.1 amidase [Actinomadura decatromicini]